MQTADGTDHTLWSDSYMSFFLEKQQKAAKKHLFTTRITHFDPLQTTFFRKKAKNNKAPSIHFDIWMTTMFNYALIILLLLFVLYLVIQVTVEGFTVEEGGGGQTEMGQH